MERTIGDGGSAGAGARLVSFGDGKLDGEAAAFEGLHVVEVDGFGGAFDGVVFDVTESVAAYQISYKGLNTS